MPRKSKTRKLVRQAFREVTGVVPQSVRTVRMKKGPKAARKMQIAIALDKARRAGARIPRKKRRS